MIRINFIRFVILTGLLFTLVNVRAQEFPIAVGSDTSFTSAVASDGVNYFIPILGDSSSPSSVTAQLISYPGTLVGQRISLGAEWTFPGAISIFDGTNYFLVWSGFDGVLKGQLISSAGTLVGSSFIIANNVSIIRQRQEFNLAYGENSSLVI